MDWTDPNTDVFGFQSSSGLMPGELSQSYGNNNWLDSVTGLLGTAANAYSTVKTADALKQTQVAPNGLLYTNGQFASNVAISPVVLLLGAAVLLFVFVKD